MPTIGATYYIKAVSYDYEQLKARLFAHTDGRGWNRPPAKKNTIAPNLAPLLEKYTSDESFKRNLKVWIGAWLSNSQKFQGTPTKTEVSRLITTYLNDVAPQ